MHRRNCLKIKAFTSRTHGNVFLRFCILSSNESPVVLDSLENCKQYKNAGKCFLVYGALNPIYDPQDWSNFKKTRNYVNTEITKKRYFHNTFEYYIENPSKTWQTINEVMSRKNNNSVILNEIDIHIIYITPTTALLWRERTNYLFFHCHRPNSAS